MKIYIGSDHGGFELKKEIIEYVNGIKENGNIFRRKNRLSNLCTKSM